MAITEVRVGHSDSLPVAVIRRQVRPSDLSKAVPEGCGLVWSWLRARQLQGGRHVAIYWDGEIRLEVGAEVTGAIPAGGDVVSSATPAGPTASVVHLGPYHQLGAAHRAIREWCSAHNLALAGPNWEIYGHWQDAWNADAALIRTDVFYQLVPGESRD